MKNPDEGHSPGLDEEPPNPIYCGPLAPPPPPPPPPDVPYPPCSMVSGASGFWLSMSLSTGMVVGGGGTWPVVESGLCIGMAEFGGRYGWGHFSSGSGAPDCIGCTIS